jgi:hypothetical protein
MRHLSSLDIHGIRRMSFPSEELDKRLVSVVLAVYRFSVGVSAVENTVVRFEPLGVSCHGPRRRADFSVATRLRTGPG